MNMEASVKGFTPLCTCEGGGGGGYYTDLTSSGGAREPRCRPASVSFASEGSGANRQGFKESDRAHELIEEFGSIVRLNL